MEVELEKLFIAAITIAAITVVFAAAVASVIGAIALRGAAQWVEELELSFGKAYLTIFATLIVTLGFVGPILAYVMGGNTPIVSNTMEVLAGLIILSTLLTVWIRIPFARAGIVSLVVLGNGAVIGLIIAGPALLVGLLEGHG